MQNNHIEKSETENGNSEGQKVADIRKLKPTSKVSISLWGSIVITILVTTVIIAYNYFTRGVEVDQSQIVQRIIDSDYSKIVERNGFIYVIYEEDGSLKKEYTYYKDNGDVSFRDVLASSGVTNPKNYYYEPQVDWGSVILIILFAAGIGLGYFMIKNMQNSGGKIWEFGQSRARLLFGKKTGVTFKDVAGIDDSKEELVEVVDFLRNPKKYIAVGARIPKGVLLVGAPGTGKTLLAKAVAGEAGVPFFHTSGSEFEEMLVGAGASRVRDLFRKAKRTSPSIIFIDEVDAIAKKRGTVLQSGNAEQTLNQLLVEMDGLEGRENVIVIAATNRPDVLDPAILRPGRFDRTVVVTMPNYDGRKQILSVHSKGKKFTKDADLDLIAKKTVGYSGADLENLLNEAAIMSAKDNRKEITSEDLMEAYLKVKLGRKKNDKRTDEDVKRIAYHEAGHAVVAKLTPDSDPVEKISIISRGLTGGVTVYVPKEDSHLYTRSKLLSSVTHAVGGKVSEETFLGQMSTGATGDIKDATEMVKNFVKRYGMSEKLGFVQYGNMEDAEFLGYRYGGENDYSEKTAQMIDDEIREIMKNAQEAARKILVDNKNTVEKLVKLLLEKEVVDSAEFDKLFEAK